MTRARQVFYPVAFTVALCALSAALVTAVDLQWRGLRELHSGLEQKKSILTALGMLDSPKTSPREVSSLFERCVTVSEREKLTVFEAADGARRIGYAFPVVGMGRGGPLRGILAVEPDRRTVLGLSWYQVEETPGIGRRITGPEFLGQFRGKSIVGPDGVPGMRLGDPAVESDEIDGITGATKTMKAVRKALNDGIRRFLAGRRNVALGRPVTVGTQPIIGEPELVTDGYSQAADGRYLELPFGTQWVQVDLGEACAVQEVVIWRDYRGQPRYRDVVVQVSTDPDFETGVTTVYNNDRDNSSGLGAGQDEEYAETRDGTVINAGGVTGRYVRVYSNGHAGDPMAMNRYVEVEVYGRTVK